MCGWTVSASQSPRRCKQLFAQVKLCFWRDKNHPEPVAFLSRESLFRMGIDNLMMNQPAGHCMRACVCALAAIALHKSAFIHLLSSRLITGSLRGFTSQPLQFMEHSVSLRSLLAAIFQFNGPRHDCLLLPHCSQSVTSSR